MPRHIKSHDTSPRLEREFNEAQAIFDRAVAPFVQDYRERSQCLSPAVGSPQWKREKEALTKLWREQTAPARALLELSEAEIAEHGEISEETSFAWDAIMPRPALMLEAAE